jgi:hypothetical protein
MLQPVPFQDEAVPTVPYCYPLLTGEPVRWEALWDRQLYVPSLWPEVPQREQAARFKWECALAERLLPLPIDHRYDADDLKRLCDGVLEVMRW